MHRAIFPLALVLLLAGCGGGAGRGNGSVPPSLPAAAATSAFPVPKAPRFAVPRSAPAFVPAKPSAARGSTVPNAAAHPAFFAGEVALSNGVYYLGFPNGNLFGYYSYLPDAHYIYHFDMGYEYVLDANDGVGGIYFYDFATSHWLYTGRQYPFPYLYDFALSAFLYYYPDTNSAGHYTTSPRYFYDFAASQIIKLPDPSTIVADASQLGPAMAKDQLGTNLLVGIQESGNPAYVSTFKKAGIGLIRWPGGGESDAYHWATNSFSSCTSFAQYPPAAAVAFDTWMQQVAVPSGVDVALTVNYGSNTNCSGGGDPAEAASWVDHANNVMHDGIKYWTVGNEQYFPEIDYNTPSHSAATYASRVAGLFYPQMKAKDPTILVGVTMAFGNQTQSPTSDPWDATVLANAKYDFVEMHYYPNYNNGGTDAAVLTTQSDELAAAFSNARTLLASNGHASAPIFLGEFDRDSGSITTGFAAHETLSIVDALFADIVIGEAAKAGVQMTASWLGIDNCANDPAPPPSLYGWQTYGTWGLAAAGGTGFSLSCPDKGAPQGTLFPKERAYEVASHFVTAGEHVLSATSSDAAVRVYAATQRGGYVFLLVNTDGVNTHSVNVGVNSSTLAQFGTTVFTYGKAEYDLSRSNVWAPPTATSLGRMANPFSMTLPPWSVTALQLGP